jgi:hypothetical protein
VSLVHFRALLCVSAYACTGWFGSVCQFKLGSFNSTLPGLGGQFYSDNTFTTPTEYLTFPRAFYAVSERALLTAPPAIFHLCIRCSIALRLCASLCPIRSFTRLLLWLGLAHRRTRLLQPCRVPLP